MLEAFEKLGCDVDLVTGYSAERKCCILKVKEKIGKGKVYDFVYSESSTMPTILTDQHHFPLHPMIDWMFFRFCNKSNIPIGLFYRDIYWHFDSYGEGLSPIKVAVAKMAYRFDLWVYQKTLSRLYLPSMEMGAYVPKVDAEIMAALPPGHTSPKLSDSNKVKLRDGNLKLFYVGGMSNHYQLHKLFRIVGKMPDVDLTVCTREAEWRAVRNGYPELTPNIHIIHETGERMEAHLKECDIAVLFVQPQEYREFASPVKLYEYLGFHKPVLASKGTLAGKFVHNNQVGWTLPYDETALGQLLRRLMEDPSEIMQIRETIGAVAEHHTWQARARQVIKDLAQ
ncbi:glycosyltransferase [Halomonas lysinitropha]|nr:glycosyltransferase [Halomonas lysinitropha]